MTVFNARNVMACAAAALSLAGCSRSEGEAKSGEPAPAATPAAASGAGTATFAPRPDIRQGVQALPRLVGDTPAIAAINADLDRIDADTEGCEQGSYSRAVTQPMTGPGYVTYALADEYFCDGAAHPSFDYTPITYDLSTGQRVDWVAVAAGLAATRPDSEGQDLPATYAPGLQSENLAEWYAREMLASTDAEWLGECRDLFTEEMLADRYFKVWLDAQTGGVAVRADFPHVVQACAETATMTEEEMRRFGVLPAIVEAVRVAHAAGNFAPKG